jgi:hypothetical protein
MIDHDTREAVIAIAREAADAILQVYAGVDPTDLPAALHRLEHAPQQLHPMPQHLLREDDEAPRVAGVVAADAVREDLPLSAMAVRVG